MGPESSPEGLIHAMQVTNDDHDNVQLEDKSEINPLVELSEPQGSANSEANTTGQQQAEEPYGLEWRDWGEEGAAVGFFRRLSAPLHPGMISQIISAPGVGSVHGTRYAILQEHYTPDFRLNYHLVVLDFSAYAEQRLRRARTSDAGAPSDSEEPLELERHVERRTRKRVRQDTEPPEGWKGIFAVDAIGKLPFVEIVTDVIGRPDKVLINGETVLLVQVRGTLLYQTFKLRCAIGRWDRCLEYVMERRYRCRLDGRVPPAEGKVEIWITMPNSAT